MATYKELLIEQMAESMHERWHVDEVEDLFLSPKSDFSRTHRHEADMREDKLAIIEKFKSKATDQ